MNKSRLFGKKGIELASNFLVIMILSIVMFGFAVYFTAQIFSKGKTMESQLDSQTSQRIEELLNDGSRVVIPFQTKTVRRGGLGVFGAGVLNVLGTTTNFKIEIDDGSAGGDGINPSKGFDKEGNEITDEDVLAKIKLIYNSNEAEIKNLDNAKFTIAADVAKDAVSGNYIANLHIIYGDGTGTFVQYGDVVYKLYIVVP